MTTPCQHTNGQFNADFRKNVTPEAPDTIVSYELHLTARCADCGKLFVFQGFPVGEDALNGPTVIPDHTKLHLPITMEPMPEYNATLN